MNNRIAFLVTGIKTQSLRSLRMVDAMLAFLLALPVHTYQKTLGMLLAGRCRFYPSCSHYALETLRVQGAFVGLPKIIWRLMRCQPFSAGGLDPVHHQSCHGHSRLHQRVAAQVRGEQQ